MPAAAVLMGGLPGINFELNKRGDIATHVYRSDEAISLILLFFDNNGVKDKG
jgi:hypothetical protein